MIATVHSIGTNSNSLRRSTRPPQSISVVPSIEYVDHPLFATAAAESSIEEMRPDIDLPAEGQTSPATVPQMLFHCDLLKRTPVSRDMERYLFLHMNFCRYRAAQLQGRGTRRALRQIEQLLSEATRIRNQLVEANERLVVSIAAGFANAVTPLDELMAAAQLPLLRAVELFDVSRGYCFSTYATHTVRNHCRRVLSRKAASERKLSIGLPENLEPSFTSDPAEDVESTEKSLVRRFFAELVDREKIIVSARFGLGNYDRPHTFQEIGGLLGLSKERARVLAGRAIEKLKLLAVQQNLTWLEA